MSIQYAYGFWINDPTLTNAEIVELGRCPALRKVALNMLRTVTADTKIPIMINGWAFY